MSSNRLVDFAEEKARINHLLGYIWPAVSIAFLALAVYSVIASGGSAATGVSVVFTLTTIYFVWPGIRLRPYFYSRVRSIPTLPRPRSRLE